MTGEFNTVNLMPGPCARSGAKHDPLAFGGPAYCPTCDREMKKERNAADLTAWATGRGRLVQTPQQTSRRRPNGMPA
jgi:hypothetical protein